MKTISKVWPFEVHKTLGIVLLTFFSVILLFSQVGPRPAFAQDQRGALSTLGQNFARALVAQDAQALAGITDPVFLRKLSSELANPTPPSFTCLGQSAQILDSSTGCIYLRCERDGMTFLVLVTCRKVQDKWIVCHARLWL